MAMRSSLERWSKRWMRPFFAEAAAQRDLRRFVELERLRRVVVARASHAVVLRFAYAAQWRRSGGPRYRAWKNGSEYLDAPGPPTGSTGAAWGALRERLCHLCTLAREAGSGVDGQPPRSSLFPAAPALPSLPDAAGKGAAASPAGTSPTKGATSAAGAISGPNSGALAPREAAFPAERRADSEASAASSVRDGRTVAAPDPPHAGARESTHAWWVGAPLQPRLCDTHRLAWPMLFPVLGDLEPEGLPPVAIAGMEAVVELAATHRLQRRLGFVYVGALP